MTINQDIVKGKWREIKGEVRKAWGKLTDDELEQTKGDVTAIGGLVQQRYGDKKEDFESKFEGIVSRFKDEKESAVNNIKTSLKE